MRYNKSKQDCTAMRQWPENYNRDHYGCHFVNPLHCTIQLIGYYIYTLYTQILITRAGEGSAVCSMLQVKMKLKNKHACLEQYTIALQKRSNRLLVQH